MSAKLARLPAMLEKPETERRQTTRHPTWGTAKLKSSHGEKADAMLADVSTHGCCVKCEATWLRKGSFISIGLDGKPVLPALIRWVRDGSVGLEFLHPIPPERSEWHALLDSPFGS